MGTNGLKCDHHGMSKTRLNNVYHHMKYRCYNKNCISYKNYGGRGIKVCDEWLGQYGFRNFYKWAMENGYDENAKRGECTLDRIDPNGNYCPENCRWISNKEQCNNKRNNKYVEMDGEKLTLQQWCDKYNISQGTVRSRIKKGMDFETAVKMPLRRTYKDMSEEELVERKRKRAEQSKKWVKDNWEYVYKQRKEWREKHIDSVRASQRKYEEKKRLGSDAEDTVE